MMLMKKHQCWKMMLMKKNIMDWTTKKKKHPPSCHLGWTMLRRARPRREELLGFRDTMGLRSTYWFWLVVSTPMKHISQLGWLFPVYGKINNVWNHQLLMLSDAQISYFCSIQMYIPCLRPCWIILVTIVTTSVDTPDAKIGNVWVRFPASQHL